MTDRAVQPEAPTTEAGRELDRYLTHYATVLGTDQEHHLDLRVHDRLILAIEAEAYRQGWDANTATSFGNRAASQERPPIDVERLAWALEHATDPEDWKRAVVPTGHSTLLSSEIPAIRRRQAELVADKYERFTNARLAGGSVASPEPSDG
jgi:hypothetical protein